jgi:hypothetical protein
MLPVRGVILPRGQLSRLLGTEVPHVASGPEAVTGDARRSLVKPLARLHGGGFPDGIGRRYVARRGSGLSGHGTEIANPRPPLQAGADSMAPITGLPVCEIPPLQSGPGRRPTPFPWITQNTLHIFDPIRSCSSKMRLHVSYPFRSRIRSPVELSVVLQPFCAA